MLLAAEAILRVFLKLEVHPQHHLNPPPWPRRRNLPELRIHLLARRIKPRRRVQPRPLRMIKRIIKLRPELRPHPLFVSEVLVSRQIVVVDAGPSKNPAPNVADCAHSRHRKHARVEEPREGAVATAQIRIASNHNLGAIRRRTGNVRSGHSSEANIDRRTSRISSNTRHLPVVGDPLHRPHRILN